jgi:flagellin
VVSGVQVTGSKLIGMIHPNIDVVFDSMIGITATIQANGWFTDAHVARDVFLHLADNTTVFQIGANEGEDMGIHIGDMRSEALGLNRVLLTDRETTARSITLIDNAIDKVSMQRAKLGAYQNRLEHTITNLTVAESRIRDTDMAKEMMHFTKLQIMLQAGTSMMTQANTLPRNILNPVCQTNN